MSIIFKYYELDDRLFTVNPEQGWLITFIDSCLPIYKIINIEKDYIEVEIINDLKNSNDNIKDFNTAYHEDFILFNRAGSYWNKAYGYPKIRDTICFLDKINNYFEVGIVNFVGKYTFGVKPFNT